MMKYRLKPSFGQKLWANVNGRQYIFYANRYETYPPEVVDFYKDVLEAEPQPKKAKPKPEPEPDPADYTEIHSNDC